MSFLKFGAIREGAGVIREGMESVTRGEEPDIPNAEYTVSTPRSNNPITGNDLWTVTQGLDLATRLDSQLPSFTHVIDVTVIGGPDAWLPRIWSLCMSTAFGRYRQAGQEGIQGATLEGFWDITGKKVRCRLSYVNSGAIGVFNNVINSVQSKNSNKIDVATFLTSGCTQETVGGNRLSWVEADGVLAAASATALAFYVGGKIVSWRNPTKAAAAAAVGVTPSRGAAAGFLVGAALESIAAARDREKYPLPDAGRLITTGVKTNPDVQPPLPPGDGLSRTYPYLALVANALTDPCYLPASPPQAEPYERKGKRFAPSLWETRRPLNKKVTEYRENTPIPSKDFGNTGEIIVDVKDGYPKAVPKLLVDLSGETNEGV